VGSSPCSGQSRL